MGGGVGALGSGVSLVSAIGTAAAMAAGVGLAANMARAGMAGGAAGSHALMQAVSNGAGSAPPPTHDDHRPEWWPTWKWAEREPHKSSSKRKSKPGACR